MNFSDHTLEEWVELVRPILKSVDFHDIVRDLDTLTPRTKELLLMLCNRDGERVVSFSEVARQINRSAGYVRQVFTNGQFQIRLALRGIALYLEGQPTGAWVTLPTTHLKLVNREEYEKRLTKIGKVRQQLDDIKDQICEVALMQLDLKKRKKELEAAAEKLKTQLDQYDVPIR